MKLNKGEAFELVSRTLGQMELLMKPGRTAVISFFFAAIVTGCTNDDRTSERKITLEEVFMEYTINGEEDLPQVTCIMQFKRSDAEGETVNVEPGRVELDGLRVSPDSAKRSGVYYEMQQLLESFTGRHSIVFTAADGSRFSNDFEFFAFGLQEELRPVVNRKPFVIRLRNFPKTGVPLRLLLLDTAFASSGYNELVPVTNGEVHISQQMLDNLKNGPVNLELYMEQEEPLQQATRAGGRISVTYGLKRTFELVN